MSLVAALPLLDALIPGLAAVYLFGSEARGDARSDSDLDLAVMAVTPVGPDALARAREALEASLNRDVDLIDLATAPLPLARQVLLDGRRVLDRHPAAADLFEVRLMREYEELKRRRVGIERDIVQRGRVIAA